MPKISIMVFREGKIGFVECVQESDDHYRVYSKEQYIGSIVLDKDMKWYGQTPDYHIVVGRNLADIAGTLLELTR